MKRFCLYFLVAAITFSIGVLTIPKAYKSIVSEAPNIPALSLDVPCTPDSFTLKRQPDATLQLNIIEANCNGTSWNA